MAELYTPDWFYLKASADKYKTIKESADKERAEFIKNYGPDVLKSLNGKELLLKMFKGPKDTTGDYLINVLERRTGTFGSGNLGNAHNAGLLYKSANEHYLEMYNEQYDYLIESAYEFNPLLVDNKSGKRGRKKKGKIRALIERLDNYKGAVCLFFNDFKVAFDNNQAERDLRMIKVKTKVSGCFRSEDGIRDYLAAMSYIGTAKKHGKNAFQAILNVFEGNIFYAIEE